MKKILSACFVSFILCVISFVCSAKDSENLFIVSGKSARPKNSSELTNEQLLRAVSAGGELRNRNIRNLILTGCTGLTYIPELSGLNRLRVLSLDGCTGLMDTEVSVLLGLSGLISLESLNLVRCTGRTLHPAAE
jgi:hypothetical protein